MEKPKRLTPSPLAILTEALKRNWGKAHAPFRFYDARPRITRKAPSDFVEPNCAQHLRLRVTHNGTAFVYPQNRHARFS